MPGPSVTRCTGQAIIQPITPTCSPRFAQVYRWDCAASRSGARTQADLVEPVAMSFTSAGHNYPFSSRTFAIMHLPKFNEPWNFEPETLDIVRDLAVEISAQSVPLFRSKVAVEQGLPLLRHLVLDFQDDPTVRHIEDQFMCGRNLLVAPILTPNNTGKSICPRETGMTFGAASELRGGAG